MFNKTFNKTMFNKTKRIIAGISLAYCLLNTEAGAQNNDMRFSETNIGLKTSPVVLNLEDDFGIFKRSELPNIEGYAALRATDSIDVYAAKTGLTNHRYGGAVDSKIFNIFPLSIFTNFFEKYKISFGSAIDYSYDNIGNNLVSNSVIGRDTLYTNTQVLKTDNLWSKKFYADIDGYGLSYTSNNIKDNTDVRALIIYKAAESVSQQDIGINLNTSIYSLNLSNYGKIMLLDNTIKTELDNTIKTEDNQKGTENIQESNKAYIINFNVQKIFVRSDKIESPDRTGSDDRAEFDRVESDGTKANSVRYIGLEGYYYGNNPSMSSWDVTLRATYHQSILIPVHQSILNLVQSPVQNVGAVEETGDVDLGLNAALTYSQNLKDIRNKPKTLDLVLCSDEFIGIEEYALEKSIIDSLSYATTPQSMNNLMNIFYATDQLVGSPIKFRAKFGSHSPEFFVGVDIGKLFHNIPLFFAYNNSDRGIFNNDDSYVNRNTLSLGFREKHLYFVIRALLDGSKEFQPAVGYVCPL